MRKSAPGFRRVAVVAKRGPEEGLTIAQEIRERLTRRGIRVRLDDVTSRALGLKDGFARDSLPRGTDLAIVAGGDGTLLGVARAAAPMGVPILGVNFGGLGFLSELQPDELWNGIDRVLTGDYRIEERTTLRVRLRRKRGAGNEHIVLNDAVLTKSALARIVGIRVRIDGDAVAAYAADGLILATPTGSTAYNLSAGGPVLDPRVGAFVVTPICPHALGHRPLVVPGSVGVEVALDSDDDQGHLTLDGQIGFALRHGDTVAASLAPTPVRLVRVAGRGFFEVLRRKLHWGER